jgi:polyhydroxyalkanoate synthesis repressor PhaR
LVTIKRYPNRKLYDTESKQYVTLDRVAELIRQGAEVQVIDHSSGKDLTVLTLTQIMMEQERRQTGLLSGSLLTGLIRSSGDRLSALQHGIRLPQSIFRTFDDELRLRVDELVFAGELTDAEGNNLMEKLLNPTARLADQHQLEKDIEAYLEQRQIPTREELRKLSDQLDQISSNLSEVLQLDDLRSSRSDPDHESPLT